MAEVNRMLDMPLDDIIKQDKRQRPKMGKARAGNRNKRDLASAAGERSSNLRAKKIDKMRGIESTSNTSNANGSNTRKERKERFKGTITRALGNSSNNGAKAGNWNVQQKQRELNKQKKLRQEKVKGSGKNNNNNNNNKQSNGNSNTPNITISVPNPSAQTRKNPVVKANRPAVRASPKLISRVRAARITKKGPKDTNKKDSAQPTTLNERFSATAKPQTKSKTNISISTRGLKGLKPRTGRVNNNASTTNRRITIKRR